MPDLASPLIAWYRANARDLPWRRHGFGAWGVLVSEFMLQQTPVARVIPHLEAWLDRWPTPSDRAAGYPDTGDDRRRQARYEGSNRQARGAVLKTLRDAATHAVPLAEVVADWPDALQRDRAIDSVIADGLAEASQ